MAEGVLVAKKDFNAPKHEELDVPNLEVIKAMQSLTSKGLVKTQFSWQWYYYVLTPEGVEYLREWCAVDPPSPSLSRVLTESLSFHRYLNLKASPPHRDCPRDAQKGGTPTPSRHCPSRRRRGRLPPAPRRPRGVQEEGGRARRVQATIRWCRPWWSPGVDVPSL